MKEYVITPRDRLMHENAPVAVSIQADERPEINPVLKSWEKQRANENILSKQDIPSDILLKIYNVLTKIDNKDDSEEHQERMDGTRTQAEIVKHLLTFIPTALRVQASNILNKIIKHKNISLDKFGFLFNQENGIRVRGERILGLIFTRDMNMTNTEREFLESVIEIFPTKSIKNPELTEIKKEQRKVAYLYNTRSKFTRDSSVKRMRPDVDESFGGSIGTEHLMSSTEDPLQASARYRSSRTIDNRKGRSTSILPQMVKSWVHT